MVAILVTAGPTREHLDEVRFLANGSSGRMGCALAAVAAAAGHRVTLVLGPVAVEPPPGVTVVPVVSALEMQQAAAGLWPACDVLIAAAAVADYRPRQRLAGKPPKTGPWTLELVPNPDIVATLAAAKGERVVVGFALESAAADAVEAEARALDKLRRKHLDLIVANRSEVIGSDEAAAVLLWRDGRRETVPRAGKDRVAQRVVEAAVQLWQDRRRKA